jgi:hypothetical protein
MCDARVIDENTADCPAHAIGVGFLGTIADYRSDVGGSASRRERRRMDELSGAGACDFWAFNSAIGEPSNFVEIGLDVLSSFRAFDEVAVLEGSAGGWVDDRVGEVLTIRVAGGCTDDVVAGGLLLGCFLVPGFGAGCVSVAARASW